MSDKNINLTAPIHAATQQGKAVAAREVFMDGDKETVQQIGEKTHQLENAVKDIAATGGASTANAVSYSNETSGMTAVTAQGAIDELAAKKANSTDITSQMQTEQTRVNAELEKKFNLVNITQESGDAEDKVMSQKAVSDKLSVKTDVTKYVTDDALNLCFKELYIECTYINTDLSIGIDVSKKRFYIKNKDSIVLLIPYDKPLNGFLMMASKEIIVRIIINDFSISKNIESKICDNSFDINCNPKIYDALGIKSLPSAEQFSIFPFTRGFGYYKYDGTFVEDVNKNFSVRKLKFDCEEGEKYYINISGVDLSSNPIALIDKDENVYNYIPKLKGNKDFYDSAFVLSIPKSIVKVAVVGRGMYVFKISNSNLCNFVDITSKFTKSKNNTYFYNTEEKQGLNMNYYSYTCEEDCILYLNGHLGITLSLIYNVNDSIALSTKKSSTDSVEYHSFVCLHKGDNIKINALSTKPFSFLKKEEIGTIKDVTLDKKSYARCDMQWIELEKAIMQSGVVDNEVSANINKLPTSKAVCDYVKQFLKDKPVVSNSPITIVAASNSSNIAKSIANYVCDGEADENEINIAIQSLANGGSILLCSGKYNISSPINIGSKQIELFGEGASLNLHEDTIDVNLQGTALQAVSNTDIIIIGSAKGVSVHDIGIFGFGRNKAENTSFGIKFLKGADTDYLYNLMLTNCDVAIGSEEAIDVVYIHDCQIQRNKLGLLFLSGGDINVYNNLFCENIGKNVVAYANEEMYVSCLYSKIKARVYGNDIRRCGMCYDIFNKYGLESKLESDAVNPVLGFYISGRMCNISNNNFFDQIYGNCIMIENADFANISNNYFRDWGYEGLADKYLAAIYIKPKTTATCIHGNSFYNQKVANYKFQTKYAIFEEDSENPTYYNYSVSVHSNFIGNMNVANDTGCKLVGTGTGNVFESNIVFNI